MSSQEFVPAKRDLPVEPDTATFLHEPLQTFDPNRHIAPAVAHELNNIMTIVQGYSERLLLHHGGDPTLMPHLKLISEASKRATAILRKARPPTAIQTLRPDSQPVQADA